MNTIHFYAKYLKKLTGLALMTTLLLISCSHDYFVDENNLRIYVPQVQDGSISNLYISFHDASGNHRQTRVIEAPFDKNELMKQGILQFKLAPGDYDVSILANYQKGNITEGRSFFESYAGYQENSTTNRYLTTTSNPRAILTDIKAFPIGHPSGKVAKTVDLTPATCFKGQVISKFNDLPSSITKIEVEYSGLSTKLLLDGEFTSFTETDLTFSATSLSGTRAPGVLSISDLLFPSDNLMVPHSVTTRATPVDPAKSISLLVKFYSGETVIGTSQFTQEDLDALSLDKRPVDGEGNPVTSLVLNLRQTIIFTFKEFTLISIELSDWGEIIPGEPTPM